MHTTSTSVGRWGCDPGMRIPSIHGDCRATRQQQTEHIEVLTSVTDRVRDSSRVMKDK